MIKIVVVDSGWNLVGTPFKAKDSEQYGLKDASVIRRWGTSRGLGQIAFDGPTPETVLDKVGTVHIEKRQIKFIIDCDATKWKDK